MTPEAKAREIALRLVGNPYGIEPFLEFIVQALRDVERETLERAAKLFREARVAHHTTRATNGEIPCAQISILADMDANQFRSLLQKEGR